MHQIEQLLRREIGLDAASIGTSTIERTVRLRLKALGLTKFEDYERLLESSRAEWEELVESVVVTETWFFRDREAFAALVQRVRLNELPARSGGQLRGLSVPCSTGEEPYSLAMALLDAGLPPARFTIDALDISGRALARARGAVFGKNSFRGKTLDFRERYFQSTKDGYVLHTRVRNCVQFRRANLLEETFSDGCDTYDFIFCRNLLIYFDRATQAKALGTLHRLLAAQGLLFVGPAELPLASGHGFVSANLPMAFACRKTDATSPASRSTGRGVSTRAPRFVASPPSPAVAKNTPSSPGTPPKRPAPVHVAPPPPEDLGAARQLADAGKLLEAAAICEAHVRRQGPSAQAFYLLGLVRDADGDPQAMDYYRKALYLEPDHYETLLQMSLLLEKSGDAAGARTLKRRAARAQQKK